MFETYNALKTLAEEEYKDIVTETTILHKRAIGSAKLRVIFKNRSFLDVWLTETGKYSYHWEERAQTGKIFRYDNAPDFPEISTFPKHLHDGDEKNVKPSTLSDNPQTALREILDFIRTNLFLR